MPGLRFRPNRLRQLQLLGWQQSAMREHANDFQLRRMREYLFHFCVQRHSDWLYWWPMQRHMQCRTDGVLFVLQRPHLYKPLDRPQQLW